VVRLITAGTVLGIEGIETAAAAMRMFRIPCWAACTANQLTKFEPPKGIQRLVIYGDSDANGAGQRAAHSLAAKLAGNIKVEVAVPEACDTDWNDVFDERRQVMGGVVSRSTEIAIRYKRAKRPHEAVSIVALRLKELARLFRDRYGHELLDDDAGRDDTFIATNHLESGVDAEHRIRRWLSLWCGGRRRCQPDNRKPSPVTRRAKTRAPGK
jgi:Toprim domain